MYVQAYRFVPLELYAYSTLIAENMANSSSGRIDRRSYPHLDIGYGSFRLLVVPAFKVITISARFFPNSIESRFPLRSCFQVISHP